jgi:hypothetical protein
MNRSFHWSWRTSERLLTGEGVEPTFLVTKPFARDSVKAAIGQALLLRDG